MPRSLVLLGFLSLLAGLSGPAAGLHSAQATAVKPYGAAAQVDLVGLIAPPPTKAETEKEIELMLGLQDKRSAEEAEACKADAVISVFRFADVLGVSFTASALPKTAELFERVVATANVPLEVAKKHYDRPRPPRFDARIQPCVPVPANASYPSGHSTCGNLMATLLADMVPEKAAELRARGLLFGDHRVLGGVHYPSDVDAGRLCAAALAQALHEDAEFAQEYGAARAELRAGLGLNP